MFSDSTRAKGKKIPSFLTSNLKEIFWWRSGEPKGTTTPTTFTLLRKGEGAMNVEQLKV
jgi:hypothetical protein